MTSSRTGPVSLRGSSVSPTYAGLVKSHVSTATLHVFQNSLATRKTLALQEAELLTVSLNFAFNTF